MSARPIMIQGTQSDAGKSMIATALCRIFSEDGWKTAPFKSQNMALNSYITTDGKEIGRAQGVQAEAAGVEATTEMNPILIKPSAESRAQIVVHGAPLRSMEAGEYRKDFYDTGLAVIKEAYRSLAGKYERIVIEGAGSPAEVNLNDRELVNMRVAAIAGSPVILVADIDRGGVFASIVGTLELLSEEDRARVAGIIINKFRGDLSLLQPGVDWLQDYTGKPVLGVLPFIEGLAIEEEDSLGIARYGKTTAEAVIDIAIIAYPRVSNYTDMDPFKYEPDCSVRFVKRVKDLGDPDMILLPGSKSTIADLIHLHESGLAEALIEKAETTLTIGICGGYQMLGAEVTDPFRLESEHESVRGLGLLPSLRTEIAHQKVTVRTKGKAAWENKRVPLSGYEIHMGKTLHRETPWIEKEDGEMEGAAAGKAAGTYLHDLFHNDEFRHHLLNSVRLQKGKEAIERPVFSELREASFAKLAAQFRSSIDMEKLERIMQEFEQKGEK